MEKSAIKIQIVEKGATWIMGCLPDGSVYIRMQEENKESVSEWTGDSLLGQTEINLKFLKGFIAGHNVVGDIHKVKIITGISFP